MTGLMRQSGTFKWTSGINYNYSNWDTNQPINRGRDCVALIPIHSNSNGYRWMTQLCSHSYAYICQAPGTWHTCSRYCLRYFDGYIFIRCWHQSLRYQCFISDFKRKFISISESSFNQQSNTGLIAALSIIAVAAVAIILCIAFAYKYPNSSLGRSLTKCRTGSCITMCKKSQSDFGNSSIRASRLKEEVIAWKYEYSLFCNNQPLSISYLHHKFVTNLYKTLIKILRY